MYDELAKRLRKLSGTDNLSEFDEAADAIEELQADNAALNGTVTNLLEQIKDLGKPRWIPVKERLPEASGHYLVCIECKCDGESFIPWTQMAWFHEKFYWEYQYGDDIFNETVTHWMPMPEPPEEE